MELVEADQPTTLRFAFYRASALGLVPKTQAGYRRVQRDVYKLREDGVMPFAWIVDNTRWMRKPSTHDGLGDFLANAAMTYRRDLWAQSSAYVEVWCESDSVAGVLGAITTEYDVPLMVVRGYCSVPFAWSAAQNILHDGRPAHLYYFGDYDPSGLNIEESLREALARYAPGADIAFERVAVTAEDIEELDLPGSIKKSSDTRSRGFTGKAVEIESIAAETLRGWCRWAVERHIDQDRLAQLRAVEDRERDDLHLMAADYIPSGEA